jgi:hypothetical protein
MPIFTRSPKFLSKTTNYTIYGILDIWVWYGGKYQNLQASTYTLRKNAIDKRVTFEISELIRDYLDDNFNGDYESEVAWVKTEFKLFDLQDNLLLKEVLTDFALDGYSYYQDDLQAATPNALLTNREIFVLDDSVFRIPVLTENNPFITFLKDGEIIATTTLTDSPLSVNQVKYVSINGTTENWDSFKERVLEDGATSYEPNLCLQQYLNDFSVGSVDKIIITDDISETPEVINVRVVQECKYEPKKVTFINKYGALQDMYFYKKSVEEINVKKESYKSNVLEEYQFDSSKHVFRDFNVIGKESVTLSSGFLSENYNEVFKQLMLSEKVWVTNIIETGEQISPVNVKTKSLKYKTNLNDKLVEYTFDFDNSFDTINNIR